ncbi:MAG: cysteine--tRNA ligase, partial [Nitrosomonadales bacterium]|nr:cysteine--tRNA ligase [Nitrosomonadales bacterium]
LKNVPPVEVDIDWNLPFAARFKEAMDDDFNTPEAMAVLFDLVKEVNSSKSAEVAGQLKALGNLLGLLNSEPQVFLQQTIKPELFTNINTFYEATVTQGLSTQQIDEMIVFRAEAKKAKNFAEADRIRKELSDQGVILEDSPQGTTWRRS